MDFLDDAFGSAPATGSAQADPAADFMQREQVRFGVLKIQNYGFPLRLT